MENKKTTLILSVLAVIVLVITIIGVSFAIFSSIGTGAVSNILHTGSVNVLIEGNNSDDGEIQITNTFPLADDEAIATEANIVPFSVKASINGEMNINYDLGFTDIVKGESLTTDYIKFVLMDENGYLLGNENEGIRISDIKDLEGVNGLIKEYYLTSGNFITSTSKDYKLIFWVSSDYEVPTITSNENGVHTSAAIPDSFSFKINIVSAQV